MVMHKTQRRVMLKFLKQHGGKWNSTDGEDCDICQCIESKQKGEPDGLASYISKQPYTMLLEKLEHHSALSLVHHHTRPSSLACS